MAKLVGKSEIQDMDSAAKQYNGTLGNGAKKLDEVGQAATRARTDLLFLSFGMLAAGGLLSRMGKAAKDFADTMTDAFKQVEFSAVTAGTIIGATAAETDNLREKMLQLGRDTEFTAAQAGAAMTELARAGFSVNEVLGVTEGTLKLATAAQVDLTTASNVAVGVLRGFQLNTSTANDAAGAMTVTVAELAQAANNSTTTIEQLGDSLKFVAAAAETTGISMEHVLATLMAAANNMVRAGIAGRALRMSLVQLAKLAGEATSGFSGAEETIAAYNLELWDAEGNIKDLIPIVEELEQKLKDVNDSQRAAALEALFGTRALTFWSAQLSVGSDKLREYELGLTAAASKEALFIRFGDEGVKMLNRWKQQVGDAEVDTNDLTMQLGAMGFSAEEAAAIINTLTSEVENWTEVVGDAALASKITADRLNTLHGTTLLLASSMEMLWAVMGKELAPLFVMWNRVIKQIVDWMSTWDKRVLAIIGVLILLVAVIGTFAGKILMTVGTLVMMSAAVAMLNRHLSENTAVIEVNTGATVGHMIATEGSTAAMVHQGGVMGLLKFGFGELSKSIWATTRAVTVMTGRIILLAGIMAIFVAGWVLAVRWWREGNRGGAIVIAMLTSMAVAMMLVRAGYVKMLIAGGAYIKKQIASLALTIKQAWANYMAADSYIIASKGMIVAEAGQVRLNWAMRASPLFVMGFALLALANGFKVTAFYLTLLIPIVWKFNAALWANPVWLLVMAIAALIIYLAELAGWFGGFSDEWQNSGTRSSVFEQMFHEANEAREAMVGLGTMMDDLSGRQIMARQRGMIVGEPRAPPIAGARAEEAVGGRRRFEGTVVVNVGGMNMREKLSKADARRLIDTSVTEALKKWNSEFDEEVR